MTSCCLIVCKRAALSGTATWPAESENDCDHRSRYCDGFCVPNSVPCNDECPVISNYGYSYNYYNCDGKCVKWNFKCNGVCKDEYYSCGERCIIISIKKRYGGKFQVCDGIEDCRDGEDEKGCECPGMWNCSKECMEYGMFRCDDGLACIETSKLCDGEDD